MDFEKNEFLYIVRKWAYALGEFACANYKFCDVIGWRKRFFATTLSAGQSRYLISVFASRKQIRVVENGLK